MLQAYILPRLGARKVFDVSRSDVDRLHASMHRTPTMANRVVALLSTLFELAERWNMRPPGPNPTRGIERYPEHKREREIEAEREERERR